MQPVWSSLWLGIRTTPYNVPLGILQSMVNPSLAPTQPEGLELPTFSYGGEGIPRVLKQYRFSLYGYIFPIWWSNQLNQSERVIYTRLAWITTDSDNGLVSSLWQPIAWTNFDLWLTSPLGTNCSDFFFWRLKMICKLWLSCLGLNVLKASFPHARHCHDYSNPLHIRKQHVFPTYLLICCFKSHFSMKVWYPTKWLQNVATIY